MSPPASVSITQLEPVIFLRGQSSSGEDARGRRRPVNIDAPPSQLRALVTVYLPKPSKIKEITVSLKGTARTDWPEGIGPNRVENVEEMTIFQQNISLYNAKHETAAQIGTRRRSNSVGPGIGLQEDVDWDYAAATAARANAGQASTSRSSSSPRIASGTKKKDDDRPKSSGGHGGGSNLARQIGAAAAKAGTAMIPPTLRPDMGLAKPHKEPSSSRTRPPLSRTGSGTTQYATSPDSTATTPAHSPPARFHSPWSRAASGASSAGSTNLNSTSATSFFEERGAPITPAQDLSGWHEYFASQGHERPPLYAPRSAPLDGYDAWPTEIALETPPGSEDAGYANGQVVSPVHSNASSNPPSVAATPMDRTAANSTDALASVPTTPSIAIQQPKANGTPTSASASVPGKSILHTQPAAASRQKEQTVRFDPKSRVDNALPASTVNSAKPSNGRGSAPSSRRSSIEIQKDDKHGSKGKSSTKSSTDKAKKPGLKMLINGLLKEPTAEHKTHAEDAHSDAKEFRKGTYTYPICISLPSNLPPTLHADFGFNRYVLKANVVRAGALTPNLLAEKEMTLIHAPDEDALEETDSIVVERCWEDLLSYMVVFSGKSFPIGQRIPLWLKFMPLGKVKIYRIIATLEEKTDYYAKGRRVARHEVPRKWTLMKIGHANANEPILPIISDSPSALDDSPLAALAKAAAGEDEEGDALPSILDPTGPWELATDLMIPACGTTRINLSTNHSKSNIAVHHTVRLSIRVGKTQGEWETWNDHVGSSSSVAKKDSPQLFDIIIEAPITLTHSHTATDWTALPNYWSLPAEPVDQDNAPPQELEAPLRPALPSPVMVSRTGMVGSSANGTNGSVTPTLRSPTSPGGPNGSSPPMSRNPTQLSRRWLALSADHLGRDGNNANASSDRGGAPPPAYQENARSGERTVQSTSMSRSPSAANNNATAVPGTNAVGMAH